MSALVRTLAAAPLALAVTLLTTAPAHASAIYTYTGNNFTLFSASGPTTPPDTYTTADRVTVVIELAAPLAANLSPLTPVAPLSFSFSDGVNTITSANATTSTIQFTTDSAGNIATWTASARIDAAVAGGGTLKSIVTVFYPFGVRDQGGETLCGLASVQGGCAVFGDPFYTQAGSNSNAPGVWQRQTTPPPAVPEPTSLALIGVALAGLAARRRAR